MLDKARSTLARWIGGKPAPKTTGKRMYHGAQVGRLTSDWAALNTSADSEILTSLRLLRARSRQLVRDNEYAKNAVRIIKNNVIGQGVGLQAQVTNQRGALIDRTNDAIEAAWHEWHRKESCHTAGLLHFHDMERVIWGRMVEDGEVLVRKVRQPFGVSNRIPLALEIIEADRLMDNWQSAKAPNGNLIRMGVETDTWNRPVAYWLYPTHPGDYQFQSFQPSKFIRLPAEDVMHLYLIDRWPQTRGEPWFHATLKRLHDMGGYEEAEIVAARASASVMGFVETPELPESDGQADGQNLSDMQPGIIKGLLPGQKFTGFAPTRPNAAMADFMRYMLRGVASGVGMSYESLSRDYSQSNYSSSRLALLDDRDLWRVLQSWHIRNFRMELHREWLDAAVLVGAVAIPDYWTNQQKYQAVRFKPRGWSWIDPTREVMAYKQAVRSGFMTVADVIAQTAGGMDVEDVFKARRQELDMMAEMDLVSDTDVAQVDDKGQAQKLPTAQEQVDAPAEDETPQEDAMDAADSETPEEDATESPADETDESEQAAA